VHEAVKLGINFFDTSPAYGASKAETVLGRGLRSLPRDSFIVGSKVGKYSKESFDFSAERVTRSVEESMARLGVNYLDIVQCHDIEFGNLDVVADVTLPALVKLRDAGKIRAIGVTGYPLEIFPYVLARAAPKSVDVVLSYCNYTLQSNRLIGLTAGLKRDYGVGVINASPLSMGLLTDGGCPDWHPASGAVRKAAGVANEVCKKAGVSLPTIAMQYALAGARECGFACTLVGIESRTRLRKNIEIMTTAVNTDLVSNVLDAFAVVRNETWDSGKFLGSAAR
jgi:L-galactose dehydrogenase